MANRGGSIKWNLSAFEEIRRMPEVEDAIDGEVSRVLLEVGEGFEGDVEHGSTRSRGYVVTATNEAIMRDARDHVLLSALLRGAVG